MTKVYRDVMRPVRLADGRKVSALAFLVDERHEQFAGDWTSSSNWPWCGRAGISGRNVEYVLNTARHLSELGIHDRQLMALAELLVRDAAVAA